jgi:hypothetical protein
MVSKRSNADEGVDAVVEGVIAIFLIADMQMCGFFE